MTALTLIGGGGILGFANHFTKEDKEIREEVKTVQLDVKGISAKLDFLLEERGAKYNPDTGKVEVMKEKNLLAK